MNKKFNIDKKPLLIIYTLFFLSYLPLKAQENHVVIDEVNQVFNKMVLAFGSPKAAPDLKVVFDNSLNTPAIYYASPSPIIIVDADLYNICAEFHSNKLSALAIIIGHELAHYYNDHTFCTDFAFAIRKENSQFSGRLKALSKTEKIVLETEADHKGLFYACMAGYKPFNIYPKLLDNIYTKYNLSDSKTNYPTKQERKDINLQAQKKINRLYILFKSGINSLKKGEYNLAINSFNELNKFFPSRENYNNLGVAKFLMAHKYKPISRNKYLNPKRFAYPITLDEKSRLDYNNTRSQYTTKEQEIMLGLLKEAKFAFEKAISLDPSYTQSYVNLACVLDMSDNPMGAVGKILELPLEKQEKENAQKILAIAYYHLDMKKKAELIWKNLNI